MPDAGSSPFAAPADVSGMNGELDAIGTIEGDVGMDSRHNGGYW